jgi:hypothetical protein
MFGIHMEGDPRMNTRCPLWFTFFFSFGATAPIWALAYLHETLRFTSVLSIFDSR